MCRNGKFLYYQYHFLVGKKMITSKMNTSQNFFRINIDETTCFYFCKHFYKAFKDEKVKINYFVIINYSLNQTACYCADCLERISKYFKHLYTLSNEFFLT